MTKSKAGHIEADDPRLTFVPLEDATVPPPGIIEHLKDRWWAKHPERGLVYFDRQFPQCNANEGTARRLAEMYPWAEVVFIPSVFRRINPRDYC